MTAQITEISPVLVEVQVEVPWDRVSKALEDGYARAQRTAKLRGFRPGKVPRNVVKQVFGSQVRYEAVSALVEESLLEALKEHEVSPVATPSVEPKPLEDGKPLSYSARIEVRPKIESVSTDGLVVERPSSEISDAEVDKEVERLRMEHSVVRALETPRPAQKGDLLTLDYAIAIDGVDKPEMAATGRPAELGADRLLPELDKGLVGATVGEERSIDVKFADDHGSDDLRGKTATFKVKVIEQKERVLPELDDDFAADCGDFKTLLELRLDLRKKLEDAAGKRADAAVREKVVEKLVEKNPVPVPPSMVQGQTRAMVQEFAQLLGMSPDQLPLSDQMSTEFKARAESKVRAALLLGALAKREKMTVSDADVDARLLEMAARTGKNPARLRVEYQKGDDKRDSLESQILEGKLLDYLLSVATIAAAPAEAAKSE